MNDESKVQPTQSKRDDESAIENNTTGLVTDILDNPSKYRDENGVVNQDIVKDLADQIMSILES